MALKILAATRKGLVHAFARLAPAQNPWRVERTDFLADNVSLMLHDPRSGRLYAALDHGHFGVKMHTAEAPAQRGLKRPHPPIRPSPTMTTKSICGANQSHGARCASGAWKPAAPISRACCGAARFPAGCSARTITARRGASSTACGVTPSASEWMGGGADLPGLHSICVDPRDSKVVRIGVSSGGVWMTRDGGATWTNDNTGMWQDHAPEEHKFNPNGQDAHRLVQVAVAP